MSPLLSFFGMDIAGEKSVTASKKKHGGGLAEEVQRKLMGKELQHLNTNQVSEERALETSCLCSCRLPQCACWVLLAWLGEHCVMMKPSLSQAGAPGKAGWLGWLCTALCALCSGFCLQGCSLAKAVSGCSCIAVTQSCPWVARPVRFGSLLWVWRSVEQWSKAWVRCKFWVTSCRAPCKCLSSSQQCYGPQVSNMIPAH